jgi:energy-coupling factor transporter ATP-binding protein EcfA2
MKIQKIRIEKIRGVKDIEIIPNGESVVIYGPNGSGKSAIVDAIDFLLTGKISRLEGEGAGELKLKEHGPHVDYRDKLKEAIVSAEILIPESQEIIHLERKMSTPTTLKIEPKDKEDDLNKYWNLAGLHQYVLSRKEILKYITAEGGKRATEIQALLNLNQVESIRKALVALKNETEKNEAATKTTVDSTCESIKNVCNIGTFSLPDVLKEINSLRKILGSDEIKTLITNEIKKGINVKKGLESSETLSTEQTQNYLKSMNEIFELKEKIVLNEKTIRDCLEKISKDKDLNKGLNQKTLIDLGLKLVVGDICPLCEKEWETGKLLIYLKERHKKAIEAEQVFKQLNDAIIYVKDKMGKLLTYANNAMKFKSENKEFTLKSTEFIQSLTQWNESLKTLSDNVGANKLPDKSINELFNGNIIQLTLENIPKDSNISVEQAAWENLVRIELLLCQYEQNVDKNNKSKLLALKSLKLLEYFESSRDFVLKTIYDAIKDNFCKYYSEIHGDDEKKFDSKFTPEGAALMLEVDFYGRGLFPPHALHSEGHQDSMGICLYLALNKYLTNDLMSLTVLDDVLMSIDSSHKRGVCKLLKNNFANRQFFITTHDPIWAKQLKAESIVKSKNMIEFEGWSLDSGPIYKEDPNVWDKISVDLNSNKISEAAQKLRRESEYFFESLCDSYRSKMQYRGDNRYTLSDYANSACAQYRDFLKQAKNTAIKYKREDVKTILESMEISFSDKFQKTKIEEWLINEEVHYNKWDYLQKTDFEPVVAAFKDLHNEFFCSKCGSVIGVSFEGFKAKALMCNCGTVSITL